MTSQQQMSEIVFFSAKALEGRAFSSLSDNEKGLYRKLVEYGCLEGISATSRNTRDLVGKAILFN